jgi:hypothetical protein
MTLSLPGLTNTNLNRMGIADFLSENYQRQNQITVGSEYAPN